MNPSASEPLVLIVDDDGETRAAVRDLLTENGLSVREADTGRAALDILTSRERPALVLLDLDMPLMSGLELLDIMRKYDRLARIPVVVFTGTPWSPDGQPVVKVLGKAAGPRALVSIAKKYTSAA